MDDAELDRLILNSLPTFIARNYKTLLEATSARDRVALIARVYDLWLRMLTITLVSQYLVHDKDTISNPELNALLKENFQGLTIDGWQAIFFKTLNVYKGNRDRFFIPELYDFYWNAADLPNDQHSDEPPGAMKEPFDRLTEETIVFAPDRRALNASRGIGSDHDCDERATEPPRSSRRRKLIAESVGDQYTDRAEDQHRPHTREEERSFGEYDSGRKEKIARGQ